MFQILRSIFKTFKISSFKEHYHTKDSWIRFIISHIFVSNIKYLLKKIKLFNYFTITYNSNTCFFFMFFERVLRLKQHAYKYDKIKFSKIAFLSNLCNVFKNFSHFHFQILVVWSNFKFSYSISSSSKNRSKLQIKKYKLLHFKKYVKAVKIIKFDT